MVKLQLLPLGSALHERLALQGEKEKKKRREKTTYQHKRLSIRELVLDDLDNSQDTSTYLLSRVSMIVCTHPQHYNLRKKKEKKKRVQG